MQCANSATFWLWIFLKVSSFKERSKTQTSKISKQMYSFLSNLPLRSQIDPLHFRKINWFPTSDSVEYWIANTVFTHRNGIVPGCIVEMFKPSHCRYSTRPQRALNTPRTNTGQKILSFFGSQKWSKANHSIKNAKYRLFLCMLLRRIFYFISKHKLNQINTALLWLILSFNSLIATLLFLVYIFIFIISSKWNASIHTYTKDRVFCDNNPEAVVKELHRKFTRVLDGVHFFKTFF